MSCAEIIDLNAAGSACLNGRSAVCVVGAGAAGIYLSRALAERGVDVILVEAGGFTAAPGSTSLGAGVQFPDDPYPGASEGRYFGLGGTTTQWGGYLIPHTTDDVRPSASDADTWRHIVRTVTERRAAVLNAIGWTDGDGFGSAAPGVRDEVLQPLDSAGLSLRSGLMMPPTRKNLSWLLTARSPVRSRIRVFCNAVVTGFQIPGAGGGPIRQLRAASIGGRTLEVTAGQFVIAAGAIESARMLLELGASTSWAAARATAGCYLADHLSLPIAVVSDDTVARAIGVFGPRFERGWMRSYRLVEARPAAEAPRAFAHFTFDTQGPGFVVTKEVLRALQSRRRPRMSPRHLALGLTDVAKLGFHRYARQRLYVPERSEVQLQLDVEQTPAKRNRVALTDRRDIFGRREVDIHWRIGEDDACRISQTARRFLSAWPRHLQLPALRPLDLARGAAKPYDAYHPVGTCRMGRDEDAVVDHELRVHGASNLWVLSTGVLPSAGTANPTFTMLCLGDRLATQLAASPTLSVPEADVAHV